MSGIVEGSTDTADGCADRRNDKGFWAGKVTWTRLKLKTLPACDDCVLNVHAAGEARARIPRARWRRRNGVTDGFHESFRVTTLCDVHKQEWLDWTPGQLTLGRLGEAR